MMQFVAPHAGVWIEINRHNIQESSIRVAPLVGVRAKYDEAVAPSGDHHWHGGSGGIFDI